MVQEHEYTIRLYPRRDIDDYSHPGKGRGVRVRLHASSAEHILLVYVFNQRGRMIYQTAVYKPLHDIDSTLSLGKNLRKELSERTKVKRPFVVVLNHRGDLVLERQFEGIDMISDLFGQEVGFNSEECDYQPRDEAPEVASVTS